MNIVCKKLSEQHYLFVDRETSLAGNEIAAAMASGFSEVFRFISQKGIKPLSMPMSVYMVMPEGDMMAFRTGVIVTADDAKSADDHIKADVLPSGDVFTTTHIGSYANLNQTHRALWQHMESIGVAKAMPVWEIYVDDPGSTPEAELRTEIYRALNE